MAMTETSLRQPLRYTIDLSAGLVQQPMRSQLMKGDKKANRVIVHLTDGGKDVTLSGVTVTGSFIRPPDAAEIPMTGEASGSEASVTLEDACYATEGYCEISVKLTVGETSRTILTLTGYVLSKGSGAYVDVSGVIPNIDDVIAQYAEMKRVTQETQAAGTAAGNAAGAANTAAGAANAQAQAAQQAAQAANTAAAKIDGMTVSAEKADEAGAAISQKDGAYHVNFKLPKGDTGATPDITFEVATGAAGSDVQIEQSGTPEAPHIKLTIPRGDTGAVEGVDYYEGNPKALGEASPGTANGVARGDHVHPKPTPEELGAATIDDITPGAKTTYSSEKIEGELSSLSQQIAGVGTPNLLLNSNFASPYLINMNGLTEYTGLTLVFNEWRTWDEDSVVTIHDGYISHTKALYQYVKSMDKDKIYTFAVKNTDGVIHVVSGKPIERPFVYPGMNIDYDSNQDLSFVRIWPDEGVIDLVWAVLYEGTYTAETLPTPIWLHPRLEMIRIGLPTQPVNLLDNSDFRNPVNQRGQTSYTSAGSAMYTIDRWVIDGTGVELSIINGGVKVVNPMTSNRAVFLRFNSGFLVPGKVYTGVIALTDGTIYCGSGIATDSTTNLTSNSNDVYFQIQKTAATDQTKFVVKAGKTVSVAYCAFYEGAYTLETLPPYRQKENELAACMRRFITFASPAAAATGFSGYAHSENEARILIPLPTPMAVPSDDTKEPTVTINDITVWRIICNGNQTVVPSRVNVVGSIRNNNGEIIAVTISVVATNGGLTPGHTCLLKQQNTFTISTDL